MHHHKVQLIGKKESLRRCWYDEDLCPLSKATPVEIGLFYDLSNQDQSIEAFETWVTEHRSQLSEFNPWSHSTLSAKEICAIDRNARAYGFEIGRGKAIGRVIWYSEDNPFIHKDWQERMPEMENTMPVHSHQVRLSDELEFKTLCLVPEQECRFGDGTPEEIGAWVLWGREHSKRMASPISFEDWLLDYRVYKENIMNVRERDENDGPATLWTPGAQAGGFEQEVLIGDNRADYQERAMVLVKQVVDNDYIHPPRYGIYVVWFCKTLKNWKAWVSTTIQNGMYYEVTYNGEKGETYVDSYSKTANLCVKDGE